MKHTTTRMKTDQNRWTGTQTQWQTKKMRHTKESHYNLPYYRHHHDTCDKQNLTQSKTKDMSHAYLIFKKTQVHRIIFVALHQLLTAYLAIYLPTYLPNHLHICIHTHLPTSILTYISTYIICK
jgi:hypothetical protein